MIRINVGCGMSCIPEWFNYDNSPSIRLAAWPRLCSFLIWSGLLNDKQEGFIRYARNHDIRFIDAVRNIPHPDEAVDVVYSCHMIEHLTRQNAESFLLEARRVLKPQGIVRIVAPDMELLARKYLENQDAEWFLAKLNLNVPELAGFRAQIGFFLSGFRGHRTMYDKNTLVGVLQKAGFANVNAMPPGKTNIPHPGALDLFERMEESICCEGVKAGL